MKITNGDGKVLHVLKPGEILPAKDPAVAAQQPSDTVAAARTGGKTA